MHQPWAVNGFFMGMKDFAADGGKPSQAQAEQILDWIDTLAVDPLGHPMAELEPAEPCVASVQLPDLDSAGAVIVCYFEISHVDRTVVCRGFSREPAPFQQGTPGLINPDDEVDDADWGPPDDAPDH